MGREVQISKSGLLQQHPVTEYTPQKSGVKQIVVAGPIDLTFVQKWSLSSEAFE